MADGGQGNQNVPLQQEDAVPMAISDIGPIKTLTCFDLRNGDVTAAVSLVTKAAIPQAYKWRRVGNLPVHRSLEFTDMFIKSALYTIRLAGGAGMEVALQRKVAIVLGTARAAMTGLYVLESADLIPGETLDPVINAVVGQDRDGPITWTLAPGVDVAQRAMLLANLDITNDERAVMSDIVMCATGIPAVQGASLMSTGHHYLSDVKERSRAFYAVIEKQFWKKDPTKSWIATNTVEIQDALWHKAGHPINMTIKYRCAVDPKIAEKIQNAGAGSAASRLPAKEGVLKAAETIKTLLINVRPFFAAYKGRLDPGVLVLAIDVANSYIPHSMTGLEVGSVVPGVDIVKVKGEATPPWVTNREMALKWIEDIIGRNTDAIAIAYGFYEAIAEATVNMEGASDSQTLLSANSLQKYKNQAFASYVMGKEAYGDYKAFKAKVRQAGEYTPVKVAIT